MRNCVRLVIVAAAPALAICSTASFGAEITPTATADSHFSPRPPVHAVDSSGLTANGTATQLDDPHGTGTGDGTMYLSDADRTPVITFDLGQNYNLTAFHLWNYNEQPYDSGGTTIIAARRGIETVDMYVSSTATGEDFIRVEDDRSDFVQAPGAAGYVGEDYSLDPALYANVRRVRFDVVSNFAGNPGDVNYDSRADYDYTGIAEIRFVGTAVPEPATAGLLAVAGMSLGLRRRRDRR